ncbi:glycosyl hydrolase family 17 protein [Azospirillum sp.]|uniref:glycoside hydrolase family 17 protein n=1 Tax=Azospirillum sp. TaxID=34012 RepID=UPI003D733014
MRILKLLAVLLVAGLGTAALWYLPNRPVPLDPPPGGKLKSVSFAPFRDGQSPLTRVYPSTEQIDEDLAAIAPQVAGIRTYTSLEGLEVVPELAKKHGLQVTMGAWLSSKLDKNEAEVNSLIALANRYPDTITRVIVGNEVLLRGELTPEQITGYLRKVKAAIKQPVSYADVWEWWLKYPQMAKEVDYITIHLLPYWEDIPASVEKGAEHIAWSYREISQRFPGKPILIGETGWPTAGRARGAAAPGLVAKAQFINQVIRLAGTEGFDVNIIEAFDQNWKQKLEGTVGGHWGLYTVDRKPKFSLAGPVVENPKWVEHAALSVIAGSALVGVLVASGPALPLSALAALAVLSDGFASLYLHAADLGLHWSYYWQDLTLTAVMLALTGALGLCILMAAHRALSSGRGLSAEPLRGLVRDAGYGRLDRVGAAVTLALTALLVVWSFLIVFDGRYRNFPTWYAAIPALGLPILGWLRAGRRPAGTDWRSAMAAGSLFRPAVAVVRTPVRAPRAELWLGRLLLIGATLTLLAEGVLPVDAPLRGWLAGTSAMPLSAIDWAHPNVEALVWAGLQAMLSLPFLASVRLARAAQPAGAAQPGEVRP